MIRLRGYVTRGYGVAGENLCHLEGLIAQRTGLPHVITGTLNVHLNDEYFVKPDAAVSAHEYNKKEVILLQRAVIGGIAAVVMRPHLHEVVVGFGHGSRCLELMAPVKLRERLQLEDGSEVEVEVEGDEYWWDAARRAI